MASEPAEKNRPVYLRLAVPVTAGAMLIAVFFGLSTSSDFLSFLGAAATATATSTAMPLPASTDTPQPTSTIPATASPTMTDTPTPSPVPPTATPTYAVTPDGVKRNLSVPILMYHYVSTPPEDADIYRLDLSVTPENFREQMAWLAENGYTTITLYELVSAMNTGSVLPEKPIILTFDDGYRDNYENAFPILSELGFSGTFFILTDVAEREDPVYMSWDMLLEMSQAGMGIEVHGREHLSMENRPYDWLVFNLLGPAEAIEYYLGYRPRFIAYPSGEYDPFAIQVAQQAGYWAAVTIQHGTYQSNSDLFELTRLRVRGNWTLATFSAVIEGS